MASSYDVVVIGCGSAGSRAAVTAHKAGAKVLAVEAGELGGLCILRGCMPTKTLLETTHRLHDIRDAQRFGIEVAEPKLNFEAMMERMRQLVARFKRAKVGAVEGGGYELRRAQAHFLDAHTLDVGGERVEAKAVVIATGSVVRSFPVDLPPELLKISDDMFTLTAPPRRALVCGAGAVGLEFAQWLARIGTEVVAINRSPWLRRSDAEMGAALAEALGEEMTLCPPCQVVSAEPCDAGVRATLRGDDFESVQEFDWILNATGRVPNVEGLGLEAAGLSVSDLRGVGLDLATPQSHVFVAGDTNTQRAILHEANLEGIVAGTNAAAVAAGEKAAALYDDSTPPMSVIFSDPPVATVGRTPLELEAAGVDFRVARKDFPSQGRGIVVGARHGFMRLVAEPGGGKVLGCQIFGPRADDMIHIPTAVMRLGGSVADMASIPWYHPTLSEAFIEVCRGLSQ
jgi:pyruvate/2-oxoglutarate dehydrogenase complex dihydrolipoamide dehydrogenase (E3) component